MGPLHFEAESHYELTPAQLWTFISDTQRLNRSIGLPSASFTFDPRAEGGSVVTGLYKQGFFTISRWREHPFEFVKPRYYRILREYDVGPFTRVQGGAELKADATGTTVRVWADITPRHWLGVLAAKLLVGPQSTSRVLARCRAYEKAFLVQEAKDEVSGLPLLQASMAVYSGPPPEVDERRLDQLTKQLIRLGGDETIAGLLKKLLAEAPDDRVASMRAFEIADLWETDRRQTLATFLRATTAGLLDLRWDALCPNCRVPKEEVGTLAELSGQVHCESCHITVDANFDRLVEVRFKPSAAVRDATYRVYCTGGPQSMPHVVAQVELFPEQPVDWDVDLKVGTYVVASPQCKGATFLSVTEGEGEETTTLALEPARMVPPLVQVRPDVAVRLESGLSAPAVVQLADQSWSDTAATAALVSTMHEFRDLFSSEVLAPGLQVAIERLALLFTDLSGSTAMYERVGQARAFRLVQDHFRVLDPAIRENHGTMIKTIGDAIMAVFPSTRDAVAAALQMQCGIRGLAVAEGIDATRLLKVGIHSGACVAVTLNEKLDYFGTAVNIAARTEHECQGGEIMITADAWDDEGVAELVKGAAEQIDAHQAVLRGISEPVQLFRVSGVRCEDVAVPAAAAAVPQGAS